MSGIIFFFHAQSCVRHCLEAFFGNQFSGGAADTVCFVVNSGEGSLEMVDKLKLTLGKTGSGLALKGVCAFFESLEGGGCIRSAVAFVGA